MHQYIKNTNIQLLTTIKSLKKVTLIVLLQSKEDLSLLDFLLLDEKITQKLQEMIEAGKDTFETFFLGRSDIEYLSTAFIYSHKREKIASFLSPKMISLQKRDIGLLSSPHLRELFLEIVYLSLYSFQDYKKDSEKLSLSLIIENEEEKSFFLEKIETLENIAFCRDLGETPACDLTPEIFVKKAEKINWKHTKFKILSPHDIEKQGLGLLHAVGKGSPNKPYLLILEHISGKNLPTLGFVGKGVVFDTGGLNLKLGDGMFEMKQDMNGAATVLCIMKELDRIKNLPVNIIAAIPLAENSVSGESFRPSDIIASYTGKSVQITNTDAEGRLILGDAVGYISTNYSLDRIVTVATLTGACVHTLGFRYAGIMGTDKKLIRHLVDGSEESFEKYSELPFDDYFIEKTKSKIADLDNWTGGVKAGPTMGAAFIANFLTKGELYTHIDIAGVSINSFEPYGYNPKGATGFGVQSLSELFKNYTL